MDRYLRVYEQADDMFLTPIVAAVWRDALGYEPFVPIFDDDWLKVAGQRHVSTHTHELYVPLFPLDRSHIPNIHLCPCFLLTDLTFQTSIELHVPLFPLDRSHIPNIHLMIH